MTAEIVVMNREAVALAADSAVTIGGGEKILNNANKVFMLAPGHPVGILIYNRADFMAVPLEILIKGYRDQVAAASAELPSLEDYANGFMTYIEQNGGLFVTENQENGIFDALVGAEYDEIVRKIWGEIKSIFYEKAEITSDEIDALVIKITSDYLKAWNDSPNIFDPEKTEGFKLKLHQKFQAKIDERIKSAFENTPLSEEDFTRLGEIALLKVSKIGKAASLSPFTGLVFAGYGKNDLYPVCVSFMVFNYFCETLVFQAHTHMRIGFGETESISAVLPFAQDDVVENILSGRHPEYRRKLSKSLVKKFNSNDVETELRDVDKNFTNQYTVPIAETIGMFSKDELASVARTLVDLTSFIRRVSSGAETVGGPVDVAVISKKDGFIWIDRKHYFDLNKNLHFQYG